MPATDAPPPALEQTLSDFDLARLHGRGHETVAIVRPRCPESRPGEIVVCAPDPEADRLRPLSDQYAIPEGLGRAERQVAPGVVAGVKMDSVAMPAGVVSNRVMFNLNIGF